MQENKLALFEEKEIRRKWYNEDWYFSVEDVVYVLTESVNTKDYINKMKKRNPTLAEGWGQFVTLLQLNTNGGKQKISCADTKGILTDEIYKKNTFGLNTSQYKNLKGIEKTKRNLRDSMGNLELAITNLAEVTANEIHNTNYKQLTNNQPKKLLNE